MRVTVVVFNVFFYLFYEVAIGSAKIRETEVTIMTSKDGSKVSVIVRNVIHE